jgi:hypothetical protein
MSSALLFSLLCVRIGFSHSRVRLRATSQNGFQVGVLVYFR